SIVHQKFVHLRVNAPAIIQVQREKAPRIHDLGWLDRSRSRSVKVFRRLALDENSVRPILQDRMHRKHVGLDEVLERRDKPAVGFQLLVPPAERSRKSRADVHFIDWRVELNPIITLSTLRN